MRAGRWVASITLATVKVLPEPVTPKSTWSRSSALTPLTSSLMAVGWSPFGSNSDTDLKGRPPSDFGGLGGLTGVKVGSGTNSGRRGPRPSVIGAAESKSSGCGASANPPSWRE